MRPSGEPMRPRKFRLEVDTHTSPAPIKPLSMPPHPPHEEFVIIAPAFDRSSKLPSLRHSLYIRWLAGVTTRRTPGATRLARRSLAAAPMSSVRPPAHDPINT